jgi:hypothetical protein
MLCLAGRGTPAWPVPLPVPGGLAVPLGGWVGGPGRLAGRSLPVRSLTLGAAQRVGEHRRGLFPYPSTRWVA